MAPTLDTVRCSSCGYTPPPGVIRDDWLAVYRRGRLPWRRSRLRLVQVLCPLCVPCASPGDPPEVHRGAGWQKPVSPPPEGSRPRGLPPVRRHPL